MANKLGACCGHCVRYRTDGPRRVIEEGAAMVTRVATAAILALTRPDMAALRGWSAAGGAVHAIWLGRCLHRLASGELPDRIDGPIVLALTFMLWFCLPPLIVLASASGP